MISFSTGKLTKKTILDQLEVCFLFQMLKLLWKKLVKHVDENI